VTVGDNRAWALALLLGSCTCGGEEAAAPPSEPDEEQEPATAEDPPLLATDEPIELALDEGDTILVAAGGRLLRVPKAGGEATELLALDGRVVRDVARLAGDRTAVLSYPTGDSGPRSVSPPGDVRLLGPDGDAAPRTVVQDASISVQLASRDGALVVLDDPDAWTARVRTYDAEVREVTEEWSMRARGLPSVLLVDDRGGYVGLEAITDQGLGVFRIGDDQHANPLFIGPFDTELALAGDDLLALVAGTPTTTGTSRVENQSALMRIDRESHESSTLGDRAYRNGRDLIVGPRHACVVEHFPERLPARNHDVWAVPLDGETPAFAIVEELGDARCLLVDADAAFLATPRGVERFDLE